MFYFIKKRKRKESGLLFLIKEANGDVINNEGYDCCL